MVLISAGRELLLDCQLGSRVDCYSRLGLFHSCLQAVEHDVDEVSRELGGAHNLWCSSRQRACDDAQAQVELQRVKIGGAEVCLLGAAE